MAGQIIRPTQFVLTYGVGSIVEAAGGPRIILDFEKWGKVFSPGKKPAVDDFEIDDISASQLLNKGRIFRIPTNLDLEIPESNVVFNTGLFPRWALCERHDFLFLMGAADATKCSGCIAEGERGSARKRAIRFVRACPAGHLDDIDWHGMVHDKIHPCNSMIYQWRSQGSSLRNVSIFCQECGQSVKLSDVYTKTAGGICTGRYQERPYAGTSACNKRPQVTLRGSSSLRIPEILSTITIPRRSSKLHTIFGRSQLRSIVLSQPTWTKTDLVDRLTYLFEQDAAMVHPVEIDEVKKSDEMRILQVIDDIRQAAKKQATTMAEIKLEEFRELQNAASNGFPPDPTDENPQFQINLNNVRPDVKWHSHTLRVAPIENLRVVMVQRGYRRLGTESEVNKLVETFYDDGSNKWYPGVKQLGEGIFIDAISPLTVTDKDWSSVQQSRNDNLCHPLFVWWHTFSHRLISALSLDSGYSTASIRERVYLDVDAKSGQVHGGLLLYATQPGGDGSMGGLIALVPEFEKVLESAERNLHSCSNDPLCSEETVSSGRHNGSACYACLLLSETSCDHRNTYLDRNLLRRTI